MKEIEFRKKIDRKLEVLTDRLENLTKIVAISSRFETFFKGKTKGEQIKILSDLGLSRELVALMVGTTTDSVYSTLSHIKSKKKRKSMSSQKQEEESKDE